MGRVPLEDDALSLSGRASPLCCREAPRRQKSIEEGAQRPTMPHSHTHLLLPASDLSSLDGCPLPAHHPLAAANIKSLPLGQGGDGDSEAMAEVRVWGSSHLVWSPDIFLVIDEWGYRGHVHKYTHTKKAQGKDYFLTGGSPVTEIDFKVKYEKATRRVPKALILTDTYAVRQMIREAVIA